MKSYGPLKGKGRNMRLNKWIMGGLLVGGMTFAGVRPASAYTASDLYGTWNGTITILASPPPMEVTKSGITDYSPGAGFFNPLPDSVSFAPSSEFAFAVTGEGAIPPGFTSVGANVQTGAQVDGNTFTWDDKAVEPLSNGSTFDLLDRVYTGTIQLDPANSSLLLLTGTKTVTVLVDELPADATNAAFVTTDADFSLTKAITSESGPSGVPLPQAVWSGLAMLGGLGAIQIIRLRNRLNLNA